MISNKFRLFLFHKFIFIIISSPPPTFLVVALAFVFMASGAVLNLSMSKLRVFARNVVQHLKVTFDVFRHVCWWKETLFKYCILIFREVTST